MRGGASGGGARASPDASKHRTRTARVARCALFSPARHHTFSSSSNRVAARWAPGPHPDDAGRSGAAARPVAGAMSRPPPPDAARAMERPGRARRETVARMVVWVCGVCVWVRVCERGGGLRQRKMMKSEGGRKKKQNKKHSPPPHPPPKIMATTTTLPPPPPPSTSFPSLLPLDPAGAAWEGYTPAGDWLRLEGVPPAGSSSSSSLAGARLLVGPGLQRVLAVSEGGRGGRGRSQNARIVPTSPAFLRAANTPSPPACAPRPRPPSFWPSCAPCWTTAPRRARRPRRATRSPPRGAPRPRWRPCPTPGWPG